LTKGVLNDYFLVFYINPLREQYGDPSINYFLEIWRIFAKRGIPLYGELKVEIRDSRSSMFWRTHLCFLKTFQKIFQEKYSEITFFGEDLKVKKIFTNRS